MGNLFVKIDDELEKRFRHEVLERYGAKRGALAKAVEEAIKLWLETKAEGHG